MESKIHGKNGIFHCKLLSLNLTQAKKIKGNSMSRINTLDPGKATGVRRFLVKIMKKQYGGVLPGIMKILLVDLKIGRPAGKMYQYLHLRKDSPLTRLQREMLATVVNGVIGGAP